LIPCDIFNGLGLLHIIFWVQIYQNINFPKFWTLGPLPILNHMHVKIFKWFTSFYFWIVGYENNESVKWFCVVYRLQKLLSIKQNLWIYILSQTVHLWQQTICKNTPYVTYWYIKLFSISPKSLTFIFR